MLTRPWIAMLAPALFLVPGCDSKPDAATTKICEQAAARYITCTEETMGKEAADMVRSKKGGVEACAKDKRTVSFYRDKCLPTPDCGAFMSCVMDLAMQDPGE